MKVDFTKWGNGGWKDEEDAKDNFGFYFNQHYKPLLEKLSETQYPKIDLSESELKMLHFMCEDFLKIFVEDEDDISKNSNS